MRLPMSTHSVCEDFIGFCRSMPVTTLVGRTCQRNYTTSPPIQERDHDITVNRDIFSLAESWLRRSSEGHFGFWSNLFEQGKEGYIARQGLGQKLYLYLKKKNLGNPDKCLHFERKSGLSCEPDHAWLIGRFQFSYLDSKEQSLKCHCQLATSASHKHVLEIKFHVSSPSPYTQQLFVFKPLPSLKPSFLLWNMGIIIAQNHC